jgi:O-antigen/teichoic acid export membrane protein
MKSVIKSSFILLSLNILVKVTWVLGIEVLMQRQLGLSQYGTYYSLLNVSFLFSFFLDFGLSRYNATAIARHGSLISSQFRSMIRLKIWLAIIYLVLTYFFSIILGYEAKIRSYMVLLSLGQVFASFILFFRSVSSGLKMFLMEGWMSISDRLLMVIGCSLFLFTSWNIWLTLSTYLIIQFISFLLAFVIACVWILSLQKEPPASELSNASYKVVIRFGLPFAILTALETVNDKVGIVVVERMLENGATEAGWYAYGLRLLDAYKMFAALISVVLMPYFAQYVGDLKITKGYIRLGLTMLVFPTFSFVSLFFVYVDPLTNLLYQSNSAYAQLIILFNLLGALPYCFIYVFQPLITAHFQITKLNLIWTLGFLLNLVIIAASLHEYKALGASIAFFASASVAALVMVVMSPIKFGVYPIILTMTRFVLYAGTLLSILWYIEKTMPIWGALVIVMLYNLIAIPLFNFMSLRELKKLF